MRLFLITFLFLKIFSPVYANTIYYLTKIPNLEITKKTLQDTHFSRKSLKKIILLGNGKITKAVNIEVDHASKSAIKAVESAGGKVTVLGKKG